MAKIFEDSMSLIRHDWTLDEIRDIYNRPLLDLVFEASSVYRAHQDPSKIQVSTLLSVKTGGCSEDCKYCSQSSLYDTGTKDEPMLAIEAVVEAARRAKANGSTRFCMGTAWREIPDDQMVNVTGMIEAVRNLGLEVCATMGMVTDAQARELKKAGLSAYNHNLDSGKEFYENIISTRTYEERLETIQRLQNAGIGVCSGGIIGMGEAPEDRIDMLQRLATMKVHPESVPINILVPVEGTPIEKDSNFNFWGLLRTIATARIIMPKSFVRLSAGRKDLSQSEQTLCFLAGANSVFSGEKLLTTDNVDEDRDRELFKILGLSVKEPALGAGA